MVEHSRLYLLVTNRYAGVTTNNIMIGAVDRETISTMFLAQLGRRQWLLGLRTLRRLSHLLATQNLVTGRCTELDVKGDTFATKIFIAFQALIHSLCY